MAEEDIGIAALESIPFFSGIDRDDLRAILSTAEPASFDAGAAIVERGDPGDALYIVRSGVARVDVGGRYHDIKAGDFFGEMGVLSHRKRTATVKAQERVEAFRIPAPAFQAFLESHPRVAIAMLRALVERLREVQERVDSWMGAW